MAGASPRTKRSAWPRNAQARDGKHRNQTRRRQDELGLSARNRRKHQDIAVAVGRFKFSAQLQNSGGGSSSGGGGCGGGAAAAAAAARAGGGSVVVAATLDAEAAEAVFAAAPARSGWVTS